MRRQQGQSRHVYQQRQPAPANPFLRLRKYKAEMQEQRGSQKPSHYIPQVDDLVEIVQLAGIVEGRQDETCQAQEIEMQRPRRISAPEIYKQADRQVYRAHGVLIENGRVAFSFADADLHRKWLAAASPDLV